MLLFSIGLHFLLLFSIKGGEKSWQIRRGEDLICLIQKMRGGV